MSSISVLLPLYNGAPYIEKALISLFRQSVRDWELVVVDDGSCDEGPALVRAFRDERIKLVETPHRGLVPALNTGLEDCSGEWVVRMDGDDISHPRRLATLLEWAKREPQVDGWGSLVRLFPRRALKGGMRDYERWLNSFYLHDDILRNLFVECPIAHPSLMIKRDVLCAEGGYRDTDWPEDYDLFFRLFRKGRRLAKIPRMLYYWRYHENKTSLLDERYSLPNFFRVKYHYIKRFFPLGEKELALIGLADAGKAWLKALLGDGYKVRAVLDLHPGRIGRTYRGVPVLHPEGFGGGAFFINTACGDGARQKVRDWLGEKGYHEWRDFVCVA